LESFAQKHQAVAAINGGFFDPANRKSTSIIVQQGQLVAEPSQNERLMNNPKLAPYLKKILNRTEFRRYLCGQTVRYDIALHTQPPLTGCRLVDALGGGPRLLPELTSLQEGFLDFSNGEVIRDSLNSSQPNARTAVGITHDGSLLWVVVAQKLEASTTSGMSLQALADFMKTLGVEKAMNLDGGSSSSLYYKGKTLYGKVDEKGNLVTRSVKSVLLVQERNKKRT
jgi:exopolysaccharide biosynthesis protein